MRPAGRRIAIALWLLVAPVAEPQAFAPMSGCFAADAVCPARPSIRRQSNPGDVATEPGRAYPLLGANEAQQPSHVQIRIPEAAPRDRWVALGCGHRVEMCEEPPGPPPAAADYVLAASWQPAFCERHRSKPECRSETAGRFDATHLALHGLWPEPQSNAWCGVGPELRAADQAGHWSDLPPVDLGAGTRARLEIVMPGTQSDLERHEWLKHGTCAGAAPDAYFAAALALMDELNSGPVQDLLAAHIGDQLRAAELGAAFDQAFGAGAGQRVELACSDGLISELRLHLRGPITPPTRLADLLAAARPVTPGCTGGRIDAAGFDP
jgi:ribonuclease T2